MINDELSEQIPGLLFSLHTVTLFIVWVINTPPLIRYGITGINIIFLAIWNDCGNRDIKLMVRMGYAHEIIVEY